MVVPSCRPEQLDAFLAAWTPLFNEHDVDLIIVQDSDEGWIVEGNVRGRIECRASIPPWIPVGTDMIRSWGMYKAWDSSSDYMLTLDDDVRPLHRVDIFAEYEKAFERGAVCSEYFSVGDLTTDGGALRGFPYRERSRAPVAVQYGGWHGVLDYDAATQLVSRPQSDHEFAPVCIPVPKGAPVTTCIMNAAWRREYTPLMWQLPMVDGLYNRFGDIWSGLLQKKILDAFGKVMLINGAASVHHQRASDPIANLEREAPGVRINETLWEHLAIWNWRPIGDMMGEAYRILIDCFANHPALDDEYVNTLRYASHKWLELFGW